MRLFLEHAPDFLDGTQLTELQKGVFANMIEKLVMDAEHPLDVAKQMAKEAFRRMHEVCGLEWKALRTVRLSDHGVSIPVKHFNQDRLERCMREAKKEVGGENAQS